MSFLLFDEHNPRQLISGSDDCSVKVWDLKTLQCLKTIHTSYVVNHFCASPGQLDALSALQERVCRVSASAGNHRQDLLVAGGSVDAAVGKWQRA